ncbi:hypothetical protein Droror1_Dr00016357 [Drosera rotundifolia]
MTMTIQSLLRERKYPFIVTLSFLVLSFLLLLLLLVSSSQSPFSSSSTTTTTILSHSSPSSPTVTPPPSLPHSLSKDLQSPGFSSSDSLWEETKKGDEDEKVMDLKWEVCRGPGAVDYIPCLDNWKAIKALKSRRRMEHRERCCPRPSPRCLVPLPVGYRVPVRWPKSRDMIWFDNVPHPKLVEYKKNQNWVQKSGDYMVFPGGGTQFKDGVSKYITFIKKTLPIIEWGENIRVILDVGCGVASFGGHLLDRDVITMSFAPKDEHEAQIQFALERGIPATLSVIGTQKLTFPDNAYDLIHCARCRVHWDADGGKPLMEVNRILRPGGFYIWSATPVYRNDERDQSVWKAMEALTKAICWKVIAKTVDITGIGLVIYKKPVSSSCYEERSQNVPQMCNRETRNISWYLPLERCLPRLPHTVVWPPSWPERLIAVPNRLSTGSNAEELFAADTKHWFSLVSDIYMTRLGISWSNFRNVMDMNAHYGGFAAALVHEPLWVMNVIPVHQSDTLPIIFDRGLIGIYHDWCESLSTYPRTYDLLHSAFLFSNLSNRCDIVDVVVEMDRVLRPDGWVLIVDVKETISQLGMIFRSLHWSVSVFEEKYLVAKKSFWRPNGGHVEI